MYGIICNIRTERVIYVLDLPLRIKENEIHERDWGFRTEYEILDLRGNFVATFYKENLAKGYIAIMNALQD